MHRICSLILATAVASPLWAAPSFRSDVAPRFDAAFDPAADTAWVVSPGHPPAFPAAPPILSTIPLDLTTPVRSQGSPLVPVQSSMTSVPQSASWLTMLADDPSDTVLLDSGLTAAWRSRAVTDLYNIAQIVPTGAAIPLPGGVVGGLIIAVAALLATLIRRWRRAA